MLVPSDDFYLWNSPCNLWTMTVFIVFYLILPLLVKWIKNGKRSVVFFLLCLVVKLLQEKYFAGFLYRFFPTMDGIDAFAWDFFPRHLLYFAMGIVVYFAIKEGRQKAFALLFGTACFFYALYFGGYAKGYECFGYATATVILLCSFPVVKEWELPPLLKKERLSFGAGFANFRKYPLPSISFKGCFSVFFTNFRDRSACSPSFRRSRRIGSM